MCKPESIERALTGQQNLVVIIKNKVEKRVVTHAQIHEAPEMNLPFRLDGQAQPELPASHYIDNRIYSDPSIFEKEQQSILADSWRFVCHESELSEPLDFRLVQVAGREIILLRDEQNQLRAYLNSCPHRGAKIIREPAGRLEAGRMTCFYHLWSFDSSGRCINISQPAAYRDSGIERAHTGLLEVRVEVIFGLIFVCLGKTSESLETFLGDEVIQAMEIPFGKAELEVFHFHRTEFKANWKLFVETNNEGYHELLHLLNRTTAVAEQDYRRRNWLMYANGHASLEPARIGYENLDYEDRQDDTLPGMEPNGHVVVNLFPDMMLNCRSTVIRIDSLVPVSATRTVLECRGLGLRGESSETREKRIRHHNQVWGPTGVNLAEDLWAVQTQMLNMQSGNSRYSVIAREEDGPMSDETLRHFYAEWSRHTGLSTHRPLARAGEKST